MWLSQIGDANETPVYFDILSYYTVDDRAKYVVTEMSGYKKICVTVVLTDSTKWPPCVILNHKTLLKEHQPAALFLKLCYAKRCQGFWDTKMPNGRRVLLLVLNLYVWIKIHVVTFNTSHSITNSMQTILKLSDSKGTHSHTVCQKPMDWTSMPSDNYQVSTYKRNFTFCLWTTSNPCSVRTDSSPFICHLPTSMLQCRFWPNYLCHYCEKHFHKLLILDWMTSFVADKSCVCNSLVTAHMLSSPYWSLWIHEFSLYCMNKWEANPLLQLHTAVRWLSWSKVLV